MARKTILSITLVLLGVGTGLLVVFAYAMSGGQAAVTLTFLAAAVACIVAGSILAFTQLLDRFVNPVIDEIHEDIQDDIQDLKEQRFTTPMWMFVITGIALLVFSFFVFRFHKMEARWGPIPVIVPTVVGMAALAWGIPRTRWFQNRQAETPMWVFLIPTAGLIFTLAVGITQTEDPGLLRAARQEPIGYDAYQSPGMDLQRTVGIVDWGFELDLPSCDGDDCAVLLVIGLVVLTLVLVVGSALIPHFWLFSGTILLSLMTLIAIHDLRLRRADGKAFSNGASKTTAAPKG